MEAYSTRKRNKTVPFAETWMDLETVIQSEVSQRKKSKYRMCVKLLQLCLTLCDPVDCCLPGSSVCEILQARNIEVSCHFLLQGIFPTQGSNPRLVCLLLWQSACLPLSHWEAPGGANIA